MTTLAALLALAWPGRSVLVEADPSGGSLVARWAGICDVSYEPGLISLAATRDPITNAVIDAHTQPIADRTRLLAASPHPRQVRVALETIAESASARFSVTDVDVVVDCGRIEPASPAMAFIRRAAVALLVVRPRLADVAVAEATAAQLHHAGGPSALVCVGDGPYRPADIAAHLGLSLAAVIADDHRAAEMLAIHGPSARGLGRTRLWRSVNELAGSLAAHTPSAGHPDAAALEVSA